MARLGRLRLPQVWLERHDRLVNKALYPVIVLLFAALVPQLSAVVGSPLIFTGFSLYDSQPDLGFTLVLVGGFLPIFLLIWLWLRLVERRPLWTTGMTRPVMRPYLRGLLIGLLLFTTVVAVLGLARVLAVEEPPATQGFWPALAGALLIMLGWMIQGAAEELLARGFVLPILGVRWGTWPAVIVSSLFFSLLHLANPNISAISVLNLFLFGLLAALYALYEGQLWGVFGLHAIWNWAQGNLFGFEVSGNSIRFSKLVDLMEVGPDWLTGGLFGPEGGSVVSLTLLGAIIILMIWSRRRSNHSATV
jgi:hypothetical protein